MWSINTSSGCCLTFQARSQNSLKGGSKLKGDALCRRNFCWLIIHEGRGQWTSQLQRFRSTIKRSRASEQSDRAIKDDFHRSKFLIPVANASTGDLHVTTPCSSCMMACMPSVTIGLPLHGWRIVPCTAAVSLKIDFATLQGGSSEPPRTPPGYGPAFSKIVEQLATVIS